MGDRRFVAALLLSVLLPGGGHFVLRRPLKGGVIAGAFLVALQVLLLYLVGADRPQTAVVWSSAAGAALLWVCAAWDVVRLWRLGRRVDADETLLGGVKAMVAGDWDTALKRMELLVEADPADVDAWLYIAFVRYVRGDARGARRALARCAANDLEGTARWEVKALRERFERAG